MKKNLLARILLFPFTLLYTGIISFRNIFYEAGLLKSTAFDLPVINVGNLSIGGTGKTPHIEYLIHLLNPHLKLATLSRGYKRKSKGFKLIQSSDNALTAGDEPLQYKLKFNDVAVAVSESRNIGIPLIVQKNPDVDLILLDDAFQHRSVVPGLNILLTAYYNLFTDDFLLPAGRLREPRSSYHRADIIIVTKCPNLIDADERQNIIKKINPDPNQKILFSKYRYLDPFYIFDKEITFPLLDTHRVILISAIAHVDYLLDYLDEKCYVENIIKYEDHHYFSEFELDQFKKIYDNVSTDNTVFLTTEKDAMRLSLHKEFLMKNNIPVFVLPILVDFFDDDDKRFDHLVKDFLLNFKI